MPACLETQTTHPAAIAYNLGCSQTPANSHNTTQHRSNSTLLLQSLPNPHAFIQCVSRVSAACFAMLPAST